MSGERPPVRSGGEAGSGPQPPADRRGAAGSEARPRFVRDGAAGREAAIEVLRAGGLVALPTDTVYGLACDLAAEGGIDRLFEAKRRPRERAIVLLLAEPGQAAEIGVWPVAARVLAERFWPGGLTLVVERRPDVALPAELTAGGSTIGLRLADHPAPRALAAAVGPLPTTSANRSGSPAALDATEVEAQLGAAVDLVIDGGRVPGGTASTVVDASTGLARVLRAGAIPPADLAAALDEAGIGHALAEAG